MATAKPRLRDLVQYRSSGSNTQPSAPPQEQVEGAGEDEPGSKPERSHREPPFEQEQTDEHTALLGRAAEYTENTGLTRFILHTIVISVLAAGVILLVTLLNSSKFSTVTVPCENGYAICPDGITYPCNSTTFPCNTDNTCTPGAMQCGEPFGTCTFNVTVHGYRCICVPGYVVDSHGRYCSCEQCTSSSGLMSSSSGVMSSSSSAYDPLCANNPCFNGGTCVSVNNGSFTCTCVPNTSGPLCEIPGCTQASSMLTHQVSLSSCWQGLAPTFVPSSTVQFYGSAMNPAYGVVANNSGYFFLITQNSSTTIACTSNVLLTPSGFSRVQLANHVFTLSSTMQFYLSSLGCTSVSTACVTLLNGDLTVAQTLQYSDLSVIGPAFTSGTANILEAAPDYNNTVWVVPRSASNTIYLARWSSTFAIYYGSVDISLVAANAVQILFDDSQSRLYIQQNATSVGYLRLNTKLSGALLVSNTVYSFFSALSYPPPPDPTLSSYVPQIVAFAIDGGYPYVVLRYYTWYDSSAPSVLCYFRLNPAGVTLYSNCSVFAYPLQVSTQILAAIGSPTGAVTMLYANEVVARQCSTVQDVCVNATCYATSGSCVYSECRCRAGAFTGLYAPANCVDVNECATNYGACSTSFICVNYVGSFGCYYAGGIDLTWRKLMANSWRSSGTTGFILAPMNPRRVNANYDYVLTPFVSVDSLTSAQYVFLRSHINRTSSDRNVADSIIKFPASIPYQGAALAISMAYDSNNTDRFYAAINSLAVAVVYFEISSNTVLSIVSLAAIATMGNPICGIPAVSSTNFPGVNSVFSLGASANYSVELLFEMSATGPVNSVYVVRMDFNLTRVTSCARVLNTPSNDWGMSSYFGNVYCDAVSFPLPPTDPVFTSFASSIRYPTDQYVLSSCGYLENCGLPDPTVQESVLLQFYINGTQRTASLTTRALVGIAPSYIQYTLLFSFVLLANGDLVGIGAQNIGTVGIDFTYAATSFMYFVNPTTGAIYRNVSLFPTGTVNAQYYGGPGSCIDANLIRQSPALVYLAAEGMVDTQGTGAYLAMPAAAFLSMLTFSFNGYNSPPVEYAAPAYQHVVLTDAGSPCHTNNGACGTRYCAETISGNVRCDVCTQLQAFETLSLAAITAVNPAFQTKIVFSDPFTSTRRVFLTDLHSTLVYQLDVDSSALLSTTSAAVLEPVFNLAMDLETHASSFYAVSQTLTMSQTTNVWLAYVNYVSNSTVRSSTISTLSAAIPALTSSTYQVSAFTSDNIAVLWVLFQSPTHNLLAKFYANFTLINTLNMASILTPFNPSPVTASSFSYDFRFLFYHVNNSYPVQVYQQGGVDYVPEYFGGMLITGNRFYQTFTYTSGATIYGLSTTAFGHTAVIERVTGSVVTAAFQLVVFNYNMQTKQVYPFLVANNSFTHFSSADVPTSVLLSSSGDAYVVLSPSQAVLRLPCPSS